MGMLGGVTVGTTATQVAPLVQGISVAASSLTTGAVITLSTADAGTYTGILLTMVILRTLGGITGFTLGPALTVGWSPTVTTNPFASGISLPTTALTATVALPAAGTAIGTPGSALYLKVANTPLGTGAGTLLVDLYGCQIL